MKKIKYLLLGLLLIPFTVDAAGTAHISGPGSAESGSNVTVSVTVRNTAAWNISLYGSGNTNGCSKRFADVTNDGNNTTRTFKITCKATGVGSITFNASGDITSANGEKSYVNVSKTVKINKARKKDSESKLSSLSVDGYDIDFKSDKKDYSIVVDANVTTIKINAKPISKYAKVTGAGVKNIYGEDEKFTIVSESENGAKTVYNLLVNINDTQPIIIDLDGTKYYVVKSTKLLTAPSNTIETKVKIGSFEVPAYLNESINKTIVGLKDENGIIKYAIYDNGTYKIYNENKTNLLLSIGYKKLNGYKETTVKVGDNEYKGYKIDDRYSIVYAMNIQTGKEDFYVYDNVDNSFQVLRSESKNTVFIITTIIFALTTVGSVGYIIYTKKPSKKKTKKKTSKK